MRRDKHFSKITFRTWNYEDFLSLCEQEMDSCFSLIQTGWKLSDRWMKAVQWWVWWGKLKPGFTHSVAVFTVKVMEVLMVESDTGHNLCSVKIDAVSCFCRAFSYHWPLVLLPGASDMFGNLSGHIAAHLGNVHPATRAGDLSNSQFLSQGRLSVINGPEEGYHLLKRHSDCVNASFLLKLGDAVSGAVNVQ